MGVGMPQEILLNEFGSKVLDAFNGVPYHVGSSLTSKVWRDVDVRVILSDEEYESQGFGDPLKQLRNAKWVALCLAFSCLGKQMTGLPIDFQIQQASHANDKFNGDRSALLLVPHMFNAEPAP